MAVIGVGGLAGRVMRQLRSRLAREVGDDHREAVAMLLLDSDSRGISAAVQGNDRTARLHLIRNSDVVPSAAAGHREICAAHGAGSAAA